MAVLSDIRNDIKADLFITNATYDSQIDRAIRSAIRLYRKKRLWFLKAFDTVELASGESSVDLPDDFSAPAEFEILVDGVWKSDGNGFDYYEFDRLKREYWTHSPLDSGTPQACAVVNGTLHVSHLADQTYTIRVTYFMQDASLPTESQSSIWFDDGYDAIRSRASQIFKRESKNYTPDKEDGSIADAYLGALADQSIAYTGGR